jgi:hypothetical protein
MRTPNFSQPADASGHFSLMDRFPLWTLFNIIILIQNKVRKLFSPKVDSFNCFLAD